MTVTKYVWALLCMALAVMLILPACGDDDDEDAGTDADTDTDTDSDSDSDADLVGPGGECAIMLVGSFPAYGVCANPTDACEGGFSASLPVDAAATHNCQAGLDCCSKIDQCEGLKETVEAALAVTPSCTAETGECEAPISFKVGCPEAKPLCCLDPMEVADAGTD